MDYRRVKRVKSIIFLVRYQKVIEKIKRNVKYQAEKFSWGKAYKKTLEIYNSIWKDEI